MLLQKKLVMKPKSYAHLLLAPGLPLAAVLATCTQALAQTDPLPSWNDGPAKQAIVEFVQATTDEASEEFVPVAERIAAFD